MKIKMEKNGSFLYLCKIAFRNLFRNTRRSILSACAISLAVILIVFFASYIEGMIDSIKNIALTFESGHINITTKEFDNKKDFLPLQYPIDNLDSLTDELSKIKNIKIISPRITTAAVFTNSKVKYGTVTGLNFSEIKNTVNDKIKYGYYNYTKKSNGLLIGRFPDELSNECIIGYRLAKKMEIVKPMIDKYEFEWLESILNEENKVIFRSAYSLDEKINFYRINLFINEKKLTSKEQKDLNNKDKEHYISLLNIFMNLKPDKLPEKIGVDSSIIESLFIIDYIKFEFLDYYEFDKAGNFYYLKDLKQIQNEDLLDFISESLELRVPFKIISSQYSDKYYSPKIVGIFDYDYVIIDASAILIPLSKMQKLGTLSNKTQSLYIFAENLKNIPEIKKEIQSKLFENKDLLVKDWTQFSFLAMFQRFDFMYSIIYAIFIIVASFLIINTVLMTIHERIKEIGMMGALGMTRIEIVSVFFLESFFISILGSLIGTLLGGISTLLLSFMPISMETMTGGVEFPATNTIFIKFSLKILFTSFLFGTLLTSLCTIIPSLKSAFIKPVEALHR